MNIKTLFFSVTLAGVMVVTEACDRRQTASQPPASNKPLRIVATTNIVADLVRVLAPPHVVVEHLMGPGIDPHLYKASHGDVAKLMQADVVVYNGLHLEGKMAEIFEQLDSRQKRTIAVAAGIPSAQLIAVDANAHDPHIWMDPTLWRQAAEYVTRLLAEIDSQNAPQYSSKFLQYGLQLQALDAEIRQKLAAVPVERRILITAHDAFAYFGRAYGVEVRGLLGVSTAAEAGTADVRELAQLIVAKKIPAVFVESTVSERYLQSLQEAVSAQGGSVALGGQLFADALGDVGGPAGTYLQMMQSNVATIVAALTK